MANNRLLELLRIRDNGRCQYCGCRVIFSNRPANYSRQASVDHIIPPSRGGTDDQDNLMLACRSCNSRKGNRTLEEFRTLVTYDLFEIPHFNAQQREWLKQQGFELPDPGPIFYFEEGPGDE